MSKVTVRAHGSPALVWPHSCVLCLGVATKQDSVTIGGKGVPYCDDCHAKVQRLRNWKDGAFMTALIVGAIGALLFLIGRGAEEGWLELIRVQTWLLAGAGGAIVGGVVYAIIWLLLLPMRALFRSKVSGPGVRTAKGKEPGVTVLKFSNPRYAERFRATNHLR